MEELINSISVYTLRIQFKNKSNYCIKTEKMLKLFKHNNHIINELVFLALNGCIPFPYNKIFCESSNILFNRLKNIRPFITIYQKPFYLDTYIPIHYKEHPKYNNQYYIVSYPSRTYYSIDVLSDLFIENIRLKMKNLNQMYSPIEHWCNKFTLKKIMKRVIREKYITPFTLRKSFYKEVVEVSTLRPTILKGLFDIIIPKKHSNDVIFLDISVGFGERLLTAMSLNMKYIGYETNIELKNGHTMMINQFGNSNIHKIFYEPFISSNLFMNYKFDIVFFSPPLYINKDLKNYNVFEKFIVNSIFKSIYIAWNNLKINGVLIISLIDIEQVQICDKVRLFIDTMIKGSIYKGVIGIRNKGNIINPIWVWRKGKGKYVNKSRIKKFKKHYPTLYFMIINEFYR
jgi:hypothetical protein